MPRPTSFIDSPQASEKPYDFELRSASWRQATLFRGSDDLAVIKSVLGVTPSFEVQSSFDLHVGRTTVRRIDTGDSSISWLAIAELLEGRSPAVCIDVARSGSAPILSDARLRYRLWAHHAGWALRDIDDGLVLSAHRAWRDSETKRKMVGGFRLQVALSDEDARLTAIAASLFWPIDTSVFSLGTA